MDPINALGQQLTHKILTTVFPLAFLAMVLGVAAVTTVGFQKLRAPVVLGYILAGELTVRQITGEKRVVRAGEVSLESVGVIHNGINEGTVPLKMIVFVVGLKNVPFTVEAVVPHPTSDADA